MSVVDLPLLGPPWRADLKTCVGVEQREKLRKHPRFNPLLVLEETEATIQFAEARKK